MREVPLRPAWTQLVAVFGTFLIGPGAALALSLSLTPGSGLVQGAAVFGFVLVFVVGTLVWTGVGLAAFVIGAARSLLSGEGWRPAPHQGAARFAPPGYRAYPVLGVVVGLGVGLLAGATTDLSVGVSSGIWTLTGLGYGMLLWAAAHEGYLPFLEPE